MKKTQLFTFQCYCFKWYDCKKGFISECVQPSYVATLNSLSVYLVFAGFKLCIFVNNAIELSNISTWNSALWYTTYVAKQTWSTEYCGWNKYTQKL